MFQKMFRVSVKSGTTNGKCYIKAKEKHLQFNRQRNTRPFFYFNCRDPSIIAFILRNSKKLIHDKNRAFKPLFAFSFLSRNQNKKKTPSPHTLAEYEQYIPFALDAQEDPVRATPPTSPVVLRGY